MNGTYHFITPTSFIFSSTDRLGWSPVMAAIKADSGGEEIVAMFLTFLEPRCSIRHLHNLLTSQNIGKVYHI